MSRLLRAFLVPPVVAALQSRYRLYRQNGASFIAAFLMMCCVALGWLLLRFESPVWQRVRTERYRWYPHLSAVHPRPLDPLRYLLQTLWLLLVIPAGGIRERIVISDWPQRLRGNVHRWLNSIPARLSQSPLEKKVRGQMRGMSRIARRLLMLTGGAIATVLAMFCISQPFGYLAQFVFVVLLWSIAMVVRRIPGRFPALMLIVLSLTISCRYLWWRYTSTLNWDDPVSLICGLLLLAAETYSWTVLVLGYFQTIWPLNRKPVPMPEDIATWPSVDLLIPTYTQLT